VGRPASGMRGNSRGGRGNRGRREYKESCFQMCAEANTSSESGVRPSRRAFPPGRQNLPGQVLHRPSRKIYCIRCSGVPSPATSLYRPPPPSRPTEHSLIQCSGTRPMRVRLRLLPPAIDAPWLLPLLSYEPPGRKIERTRPLTP
jgi:hypothetical protein